MPAPRSTSGPHYISAFARFLDHIFNGAPSKIVNTNGTDPNINANANFSELCQFLQWQESAIDKAYVNSKLLVFNRLRNGRSSSALCACEEWESVPNTVPLT